MGAACCSDHPAGHIMVSELKDFGDPVNLTPMDSGFVEMPWAVAKAPVPGWTPPALQVTFMRQDGSLASVTFMRQPLGVSFGGHAPIVIKRVVPGSHGEELGVQPGWRVVAVNGNDVSHLDFGNIYERLRHASSMLLTA
mmetsp:Transcript_101385/g.292185  ORF Transcript_101385/g.292185 Transcript_101385/m.292185 type:complete len:139 (-) Transcript_101385:207-623(-)